MNSSANPLAAILVDSFYAKVADQSDRNTADKIVSPTVEFYASGSDVPVGSDDFLVMSLCSKEPFSLGI